MSTVVLAIGVAGVGKTTYIKRYVLTDQPNLKYVCPDDFRAMMDRRSGESIGQYEIRVWLNVHKRILQLLRGGYDVVVDATNAKVHNRQRLVSFCRAEGATQIIGMWFQADLPTIQKRNASRPKNQIVPQDDLLRMWEALEAEKPDCKRDGLSALIPVDLS